MTIRYEFSWDFALYSTAPALTIEDDGDAHDITFSSGTYLHTTIASVISSRTDFATALQTAINNAVNGSNVYTVFFSTTTGYNIEADSVNFTLTFTGDAGTSLKRILGFSGNQSGATEYSSDLRPYYLILPSMPARSLVSDEYEGEGISQEGSADDGTCYQISKSTAEVYCDWTQMAETDQAPAAFMSAGTYVFERQATSAVPWTYQHAFRHARDGMQPFLVAENSTSTVHELRAEGTSFHPQRFASQDIQIWNVPFKTRLLGTL